jgi:hypothetical protein
MKTFDEIRPQLSDEEFEFTRHSFTDTPLVTIVVLYESDEHEWYDYSRRR